MPDMTRVLQDVDLATRASAALLTVATAVLVWSTWRSARIARRLDRATDRVIAVVASQKLDRLADLIDNERR